MLMISIETDGTIATMRFDGRLAGAEARELTRNWPTAAFKPRHHRLLLDLTGVTFIDAIGEAFLAGAHREGAELVGGDENWRCHQRDREAHRRNGVTGKDSGAMNERRSRGADSVFSP
jgi:hypothetical protein